MKAIKVLRNMAMGSRVRIVKNGQAFENSVKDFLCGDPTLIHEKVEMLKVEDGILTIELLD